MWAILLPLHLQLSGWGTTLYIPIDPTPFKTWPWYNLYNIPMEKCAAAGYWQVNLLIFTLGSCGYPLTNLLHGLALILVGLTVNLGCKSLNVWKEGLISFVLAVGTALGWEKFELIQGISILKPDLFNSIAQAVTEAMRLLNDTVDDIFIGFIFMTSFMALVMLADHHFNYDYQDSGESKEQEEYDLGMKS